MFKNGTPESVGIESKNVQTFIERLEHYGFTSHDVLLARGDTIFCEAYWAPFHKDFLHRQYSQTKSYVGIAIGLLEEEGKLRLTDKIADYFRDKIEIELPEFLENQTIEDMLTMRTSLHAEYWFTSEDKDRVHSYFNRSTVVRPTGTTWAYDSAGSQVLCALVERLAGKPILEYMKDRLFNKMGCFQDAYILKTPTGESWGDSALICTPRDMLSFARLLMNGGVWEGERLMSEEYVKKATSAVVSNVGSGHISVSQAGYGYQIWRLADDAFAFIGMHYQLTFCYPKQDLIFVYNADNQGSVYNYGIIFNELRYHIVNRITSPLPENEAQNAALNEYIKGLTLRAVKGKDGSALIEKINGKKFVAVGENRSGITEMTFRFEGKGGKLCYENAQGKKEIPFGINENAFGKFPQLGYSNEYGGIRSTDGSTYDCATSVAFKDDNQLLLYVQVIDKYFGNMSMVVGFKGEYANVKMSKVAEDFFTEYQGEFLMKMA